MAQLPKNSVRAKQIAPGAVGTSEVKDASLLKTDFKAGQLPAGPRGPSGTPGADGRSPLDPLEAGETVRGYVGGDYDIGSVGGDWRAVTSFPVPGSSKPGHVYIDEVTVGETCTGTVLDPTAPADTLCVYPESVGNPALGVESHFAFATTQLGFAVSWTLTATGDSYFLGTYAYTQAAL